MGKSDKETSFTDVGASGQQNGAVADSTTNKYDPSKKGPNAKRSCTDIICCIIFLVFVLGLFAVAAIAFAFGDPQLLIYPEDSDGNLCGVGNMKDRKYLFFFDLVKCGKLGPGVFINGCPTPQICVKECPTGYSVALNAEKEDDLICKDGVDKAALIEKRLVDKYKGIFEAVENDDCAAYYLKSEPYINRCLPSGVLDAVNNAIEVVTDEGVTEQLRDSSNETVLKSEFDTALTAYKIFLEAKEYGEKIVADVVATYWMILILLGISMFIAMIWIVVMRWVAGFMVWLTILIFVALWGGLTGVCLYFYFEYKGEDDAFTFYLHTQLTFKKEDVFLAGGIIFGVIFLIVVLILLFLMKRIRIAVQIIKESSKAVGSMWSSLFFPIVPFILQVAIIAFWGSIATYLASVGREQDQGENNITLKNGSLDISKIQNRVKDLLGETPCNSNSSEICHFIKYGEGEYTVYLQIYNLFMLFWLVNFVSAMGQLTLSGAFASWYWAFDKSSDVPALPVSKALYRCFRYHLGSLAFGSLIIAIVQLIRVMLEYLDSKLKGAENRVAKFILKCIKCCFWCLEKFIRFLTKNAFIMMAVYGKNFCTSAKHAFELILRNIVRVAVIDKVTDFLLFICKLVVVGATGVIAYLFFDGRIDYLNDYKPEVNFYLVPIIIVILGSYVIADIFFSVYEMAVDTLFLCFLEDIERHDGSAEKPYFMGKSLMSILGKKNAKPKDQ